MPLHTYHFVGLYPNRESHGVHVADGTAGVPALSARVPPVRVGPSHSHELPRPYHLSPPVGARVRFPRVCRRGVQVHAATRRVAVEAGVPVCGRHEIRPPVDPKQQVESGAHSSIQLV